MLRAVSPNDTDTLVELTAGTRFFKPHEIETLREVLDDYHAANRDFGHRSFLWEEAGRVLGYVYHAPAPMTDRTWYLYWLAVAKDAQGRGLGRRLLEYVEQDIRGQGGRLLVIDTSGTPLYDPTRRFYLNNGYVLAATVADFYADGDDLVVFRKRLVPPAA